MSDVSKAVRPFHRFKIRWTDEGYKVSLPGLGDVEVVDAKSYDELTAELDRLRAVAEDRSERVTEARQCLEKLGEVHDGGGSLFLQVAFVVDELLKLRKVAEAAKEDLEQQKKWAASLEQVARGECPDYANGYIWSVWRRVRVLSYLLVRMQRASKA